ncbi:hypothetical protein [Gorillibacterium timonense]|uniref:hypothetical protein n=1 Tax=Gorillibacterium timonense TaxID=1689269 RepID=UPI00071E12EE|nr:hypothetical protein [Gorillibacterium timonense]
MAPDPDSARQKPKDCTAAEPDSAVCERNSDRCCFPEPDEREPVNVGSGKQRRTLTLLHPAPTAPSLAAQQNLHHRTAADPDSAVCERDSDR